MLTIDLGALGKRTIVAGMKPYYPREELMEKTIVVVVNLKPAKIRGIESKGMLLAADDDHGCVTLLNPQNASAGSEIFIEGIPREPQPSVDFEAFMKIEMTIGDNQKAQYKGKSLKSKVDTVKADKPINIGAVSYTHLTLPTN